MKQDLKIIISIVIFSIVVLAGAVFLLGRSSANSENQNQIVDQKLLIRDDSFKVATDSAQVTLVEFSDFQCPACAAVEPVIQQLLKDYQGRLNYVYRHFPLPQHKNAEIAAEAAEAAGEQGHFLEMSAKIFENQEQWESSSEPLENFTEYARELNLNIDQFRQTVESNKFTDKIKRDTTDALTLKINSTPTFYINNQKYTGSFDYSEFKAVIDKELDK